MEGHSMSYTEQPQPTNTGMWECDVCRGQYSSPLAAAYCCGD